MKRGRATFELSPAGEMTDVVFAYDDVPRGGPLAGLIGPFLDRQLRRGFGGFLDDLGAAASAV